MPVYINDIAKEHDAILKESTKNIQYLKTEYDISQSKFADIKDFNLLKSKVERSISNNKKYNWVSKAKHRMR